MGGMPLGRTFGKTPVPGAVLVHLSPERLHLWGGLRHCALMRKTFVEKLHWIDEGEMMDFTAIAQSTPGAMAVNASILVGYRMAGVPGPW